MSPKNLPQIIGRYEVIGRLGQGGMGTVFRGRDPKIGGRYVAIKLLHLTDDEMVERFLLEAATAGKLDHPNIVKVYDTGEHDGEPYIVMEFVEGVTLADQIRGRFKVSLGRKLGIIEDLARGLDYAHNMGVVHRDVKPANVMLRRDGVVKILDFGIARVANSGMTQVGMLMGTANYMSPEQVDAKTVDRRSDVFAVGLVLYELLSFRLAFAGDTTVQVMNQITREMPVPIERLCPDVDPAVAAIVQKAIQKDPARRYQTLGAMAAEIEKIRARSNDSDPDPITVEMPTPRPTPTLLGEWLREANLCLDQEHVDRASELVGRVLLSDPSSAEAQQLRVRIEAVQHRHGGGRQEPETITATLKRGRLGLSSGNFDSAIRAASEILVRDPTNAAAQLLSREALAALEERRRQEQHDAEARTAIEQQRAAFAAGRWRDAIDALERFAPPHSLVDAALVNMRSDFEALQKQRADGEQRRQAQERWVSRQLAAAKTSLDAGQFDDAIEVLEHVEQIRADASGLSELLRRAREGQAAAQAEAKRQHDIAELVSRAVSERAAGRLTSARKAADAATVLDPDHRDALAIRHDIDAAIEAARQDEQAAAARERSIEADVLAARQVFDAGRHHESLDRLQRLDGTHRLVASAREELQTRLAAIDAARLAAEQDRLAGAAVTAARAQFDAGAAAEAIAGLEQFSPPHRLVAEALEDLRAQAAEMESLQRELDKRRQRAEQLKSLAARASAALDSGDFDRGAQSAREMLAVDPASADAHALQARAKSGLENAQLKQEEGEMRTIVGHATRLADQNPIEATAILERLQVRTMAVPQLAEVNTIVQQTLLLTRQAARRQEMTDRSSRMAAAREKAASAPSTQEAVRILTEALKLDPAHDGCLDLLAARQAELVSSAERLIGDMQYREALSLLDDIAALGIEAPGLDLLRQRARSGLAPSTQRPSPPVSPSPRRSTRSAVIAATAAIVLAGGAYVAYGWRWGNRSADRQPITDSVTTTTVATSTMPPPTTTAPPTSVAASFDSGAIERALDRDDFRTAARLIVDALGKSPGDSTLGILTLRTRNQADARATEAQRRADKAGGQARREYEDATRLLRTARDLKAPAALRQAVDDYLQAATDFDEAATPPQVAVVTTTAPVVKPPTTSTSVATTVPPTVRSTTTTTSVPATTTIPTIDAASVAAILKEWADAYKSADLAAMRKVFPGVDGDATLVKRVNLHRAEKQTCDLTFRNPRAVSGSSAEAQWNVGTVEVCRSARGADTPPIIKEQSYLFGKSGAGTWIITAIIGG